MADIDFSSVIDDIQPEDLPNLLNDIARIIGIENTLKLTQILGGGHHYFPTYNKATKELQNRLALKDYRKGMSYKDIARKYGKSETWIRTLVKDMINK